MKKYYMQSTIAIGMSLTVPELDLKQVEIAAFIRSNPRAVRCTCLEYHPCANGNHFIRPNGVRGYMPPDGERDPETIYYHICLQQMLDIDKVLWYTIYRSLGQPLRQHKQGRLTS